MGLDEIGLEVIWKSTTKSEIGDGEPNGALMLCLVEVKNESKENNGGMSEENVELKVVW